jgi:hypothetical protein
MHLEMSFRPDTLPDMNTRISIATVADQTAAVRTRGCPPVVMVVWHDAWADSEQHDRAEWRSDYLVRTTGFLVRDEPDIVSIAQEILPEEDGYRAVTHIPKGMIERLTDLGPCG